MTTLFIKAACVRAARADPHNAVVLRCLRDRYHMTPPQIPVAIGVLSRPYSAPRNWSLKFEDIGLLKTCIT